MIDKRFSRRELMQGAAALGTATLIPQELLAQQAPRTASAPGSSLPARGELLIRGDAVKLPARNRYSLLIAAHCL